MNSQNFPWEAPQSQWLQTTVSFAALAAHSTDFIPPWEVDRAQEIRERLKNFDWYREKFLKVALKKGGRRVPFILNPAQVVLNNQFKNELQRFGMVRALVPKARRMGVSTLVSGRFFHRTATGRGIRAHVVAHRNDSATNLHREVKLFCEGLPDDVRPHLGGSNAKELLFDVLQSVYKVSSAEGGNIGRSDGYQLLHISEVAFIDNTEDLSSGLMATVQDEPGTEIVMESTGNGANGMFYNMCQQAHSEKNNGPWRVHFLPWTVMPEYVTEVPHGWQPPREFVDYARLHGLTLPQLYWFFVKNYTVATMNGGQPESIHRLTRQEYPAMFSECFTADSTFDFFAPSLVQQAMTSVAQPEVGALKILAVDPAGDGQDSTFVGDRQGTAVGSRVWGELKTSDQNVQADWLVDRFRSFEMDVITVDATGLGKGLVDALRLRMRQLANKVVSVNFGSGAHNRAQNGNRRAELHWKVKLWLDGRASCPNDKVLQEEFAKYKWGAGACHRDEYGRLFMTPKEKVRAELGHSPDRLDTIATSFAVNDYQ